MDDFEMINSKILEYFPSEVEFGFIPVKNQAVKIFQVENKNKFNINFIIETNDIFQFNIEKGFIPKLSKMEFKISVLPNNAIVSVGNARVIIGENKDKQMKIIKLSFISKYPYIKIQKNILDFGNVLIGKTIENEIILSNPEKVPANFIIKKKQLIEGKTVEEFFLSDLSGIVPPNSQFLIKIKFNSIYTNHFSYETFEVIVKGGNIICFSCIANSLGIRTNINEKFINFQSVELNDSKTRMIRLFNESSEATAFQFFYNNEGVFHLDQLQGIIPANSNVRIRINFKPIETITYYERIFCITKNHFLFAIDICGSSHDLLNKTKIMMQRHIDILRFKMSNGFFISQKNLINTGKDFNIFNYFETATKSFKKNFFSKDKNYGEENEPLIDSCTQIQLHKELLWENISTTRILSCNSDMVDFRFCENGKISEQFNLMLYNNTNEKMKVKWLLNKPISTSNLTKFHNLFNLENIIFIVTPEEATINRKSSFEFKVFFKPNCAEQYFFTNLTCLASLQTNYDMKFESTKGFDNTKQNMELKSQKTFTSLGYKSNLLKNLERVEKDFEYFDPPFPLKISVIGHSFPPNTQIFMPMIELIPKNEIVFEPTTLNQSVYQTFTIKNKSDTCLYYKFMPDISNIYRIYPKLGLIEPKGFNLILIEFCPKEVKSYIFPMKIIFNHDLLSMQTIMLYGLCCDPAIEIENAKKDEIFFSPSFIGISTKKFISIINRSPVKVNVQISKNAVHMTENNKNNNNIMSRYNSINMNFYSLKTQNNVNDGKEAEKIDINAKPIKQSKLALINYKENQQNNYNKINSKNTTNEHNFQSSLINITPNYFDMEPNQITKFEISFCPLVMGNIENLIEICATRIYDPQQENQGIFNPAYTLNRNNTNHEKFDKRPFKKIIKIVGKGNDGELKIEPPLLDFGTVKVGFEKKLSFSIYNPSLCNFFTKLEIEKNKDDDNFENLNLEKILKLDFNEGFINTLCKKDVNLTFHPINRANFEIKIILYATENTNDKNIQNQLSSLAFDELKSLKAEILIKANGDYPLLKICDIRNTHIPMSYLWQSFNVDFANEELLKKLTDEEMNFISNDKPNIRLQDYYEKLKCIKFDFGKHLLKRRHNNIEMHNGVPHYVDIYLTLKNVGGVTSEFFFKFPHDISIKRETWMDEIETSSNETKEYQILKNNLFDIYPRQNKLQPNEYCNIRLRYDVKQLGEHRLRVIFQIINGKPLVFELYAETHTEKKGILEIRDRVLDFSHAPMGSMMPIVCPLEIKNVGGIKLRYRILEEEINKFNTANDDFPIFKIDNKEGPLSPGETGYIIGSFRPLTNKYYRVKVPIEYSDGNNGIQFDYIILSGFGYNPRVNSPPVMESRFKNMPKSIIFNSFEGNLIQKCGVSLEELDFGTMKHTKNASQIFILYNYSKKESFNFDFFIPGFNMTDDLLLEPMKGKLEPNSHIIIKALLTPNSSLSNYFGEIECIVSWLLQGETKSISERENLYIRINKRAEMRELPGKIEQSVNPNVSFVEEAIEECIKEILCDEEFDNLLIERLDNSPLGLYEFTSNENNPTHEEVKSKMINNYYMKAINNLNENNNSFNNSVFAKRNHLNTRTNLPSQHTENSKFKEESGNKEQKEIIPRYSESSFDNIFTDNKETKIEDKYMQEIIRKNGYTNVEVNEKIIVVNQESKNLINLILENTINNIIAEAIFGDTDLTEQTKIFYFKNK